MADSCIDESTAVQTEAGVIDQAFLAADSLPSKIVLDLAEAMRASGDLDKAGELADLVEARDGAGSGVLELQARIAYAGGDPSRALELLTLRAKRYPSATASAAIARLHLDTGDLDSAAAIHQELMAGNQHLITVQQLGGDIARAQGDNANARTYFHAMVDLKTEHPGGLVALAELAHEASEMATARAFFRRAVVSIEESNVQSPPLLERAAALARTFGDIETADMFVDRQRASVAARSEARRNIFARALETAGPTPVAARPVRQPTPPPTPRRAPAEPAGLETFSTAGSDAAADPRVINALRALFGHEQLRPGQADVINAVMAGRDTLAVMPTGAGKSLTFQLPAMLRDGATIVISPLIALMKDQVDGLPEAVQAKTALINSTLSSEEMRTRLDELRRGELKLVYVAPERLRQHGFLRTLRETKIATFVIDEAHCISMWGHDFRPDYLFIPQALKEIGDPPVLAITATATQETARHIGEGLGRRLDLVRTSVFRPNLYYSVEHCANRDEKVSAMAEFCRTTHGSGIVYVSSRRDAEDLAGVLRSRRISAGHYHAGMDPQERSMAQERFMSGAIRVVVATVAFGMGIDKADVRFIVRFSPPASLEAYAQESGRAGRDGDPAKCLLLITKSDETSLRRFLRNDQTDIVELRRVYQAVRRQASGRWAIVDVSSLVNNALEDPPDPRIALGLLDQAKLIRRHPDSAAGLRLQFSRHAFDEVELSGDHMDAWLRFKNWLGADAIASGSASIQTAPACDATGLAPVELDRLLSEIPDLTFRETSRGVCLELLPAGPDAAQTMQDLLEKARNDAEERIDRVVAFAEGGQCRHQALAAHLGEKLPPCKTQCDVCAGKATGRAAVVAKKTRKETDADRLIVLRALQTAPYSLGAPSLTKLLIGAADSKIQRDRSPHFGALHDLKKSAIERLIDNLIEDALIERYERDGYRLLAVSQPGAELIGARYVSPLVRS